MIHHMKKTWEAFEKGPVLEPKRKHGPKITQFGRSLLHVLPIYIHTYMNVKIITLKHIARHRAISAMNSFVSTSVVTYTYKPSFDGLFTFIKRIGSAVTQIKLSRLLDVHEFYRCRWLRIGRKKPGCLILHNICASLHS